MAHKNLDNLLSYIVFQVEDLGGFTTTIRLVKFLYLIDIEYFRRYQKLLTGLDWIYYHFGPYAFELPKIGRRMGYKLEREEFQSGRKTGILFHAKYPQDNLKDFRHNEENLVLKILKVWAEQDTSVLLNYVYNRTEPMINARKGDKLDFCVIQPGTNYYELNITIDNEKRNY